MEKIRIKPKPTLKREDTLGLRETPTNWTLYSVGLTGVICIVAGLSELIIMLLVSQFINETYTYASSGSSPIVIIYFGLFIFGLLFQLVGSVDAWLTANTIQVVAVSLFNVLTTIYSVVQIFQVSKFQQCSRLVGDALAFVLDANLSKSSTAQLTDIRKECFLNLSYSNDTLNYDTQLKSMAAVLTEKQYLLDTVLKIEVALSIFMLLSCIGALYLSYRCYDELGWTCYIIVGADRRKHKQLSRYQLFVLLLKINAYFFVGLACQVLGIFYFTAKRNMDEFKEMPALRNQMYIWGSTMFAIVIIYLFVGFMAAGRESVRGLKFFMFISIVNFACLIYLLVLAHVENKSAYRVTITWLTAFVLIQMLSNLLTLAVSGFLLRDFQEGFSILNKDSAQINSFGGSPRFPIE